MEIVNLRLRLTEYCQKRGLNVDFVGHEHMEPFLNTVLMQLEAENKEFHQIIIAAPHMLALVKPKETKDAPVRTRTKKVQKTPAGDM